VVRSSSKPNASTRRFVSPNYPEYMIASPTLNLVLQSSTISRCTSSQRQIYSQPIMPEPYWNSELTKIVYHTIAALIKDPHRKHPVWNLVEKCPDTCHGLRETLQKFDAAGFSLKEFKILRALTTENHDDRIAMLWFVHDILPRLRETQTRFQTLETTLDLVSRSFFAFVEDISDALPIAKLTCAPYVSQERLNHLSTVLQKHKDTRCYDSKTDTLQPISKIGNISGYLNLEDRYQTLTERVQALEEMVKEDRNQMKSQQSNMTAEGSSVVGTQEMERTTQAHQPTFAALSDASWSSTCTPTPASVSGTEQIVILSQLTTGRPWSTNQLKNGTAWSSFRKPQLRP
jgi:hypothetical protein